MLHLSEVAGLVERVFAAAGREAERVGPLVLLVMLLGLLGLGALALFLMHDLLKELLKEVLELLKGYWSRGVVGD